jgi:hypothetical protein
MMRSKSFEEKASKLNFKSLIGTKYITLRDCYKGLAPFQGFMIKGTKIPYREKDYLYYSRGSEFILNTGAYRTVPYRFPLEYLSRSRSLSARRTVFLPKILRFSIKKFKSANRTVFKIKTVLAFLLIYFKSANRSAIIFKNKLRENK